MSMQCHDSLWASPFFQQVHPWLCTSICFWDRHGHMVTYVVVMVYRSLQQYMVGLWFIICQRPWFLSRRDNSPNLDGCGPMGSHGSGSLEFPSFLHVLVLLWRSLKSFHWFLFSITWVYPFYHEEFQRKAHLYRLLLTLSCSIICPHCDGVVDGPTVRPLRGL